jgi:hypothetical protein
VSDILLTDDIIPWVYRSSDHPWWRQLVRLECRNVRSWMQWALPWLRTPSSIYCFHHCICTTCEFT